MSTNENSPIVVGVDLSASADRALAWAAQAAGDRGLAVEVVHAWTMPWLGRFPDLVTVEPTAYEQSAKRVLEGAVERGSQLGFAVDLHPHFCRSTRRSRSCTPTRTPPRRCSSSVHMDGGGGDTACSAQ